MELNNARIKHLCMTLQEWEGKNPTLKAGELCLVSDYPGLYKIGIEGKKWKEIPYPHAYDHNKSDISSSYLPLTGGKRVTGTVAFTSDISGDGLESRNHAIKLGHSADDELNFYEYGGVFNFYQHRNGAETLLACINGGGLTINSTLTLRGNRGNADVFTDFNGGRGIVLRVTDSSGVLHELGMWNNGTPNYIKGNTRYNLYHAGNLGIATSTKSGLVKSGGDITVGTDGTVSVNKSKVADNANKLGNYGLFTSSSGSPAGHVPLIGADGVMEAGCYIDFHANGDTSDYNLRLMYDEDTDKKRWIKFPKASGTMALMNLIDSEDSAITIKSNCADFPAIDITAGVTGNGMRITMSDAVDTGKLEFDGNLVWIDKQTDTSATLYVSDDVLYCNKDISSKGFYQSSDIRIKKNIREICRNDNRLEMAGDLSLKEFDMAGTERHAFGFIAQEVREKFPELVSEDKNGFLSLDYTSLLLLKIGFLEKKLSEVMSKLNNMDKRTNH